MFESCIEIRDHFSDYVDGLCSQEDLLSIRYHLRYCVPCQRELDRAELLRDDLGTLPRRPVPEEAGLRLRVRVSQALNHNMLSRIWVRLDNYLPSRLLPATGGLLATVLFFCLLLGSEAAPINNVPDVPLSFVTPPQVLTLAPLDFDTGDEPVIVVMYIGADGHVTGYKILSGQHSPELTEHLDRLLYFSRFEPATTFGAPTDGRVILDLREITVRG